MTKGLYFRVAQTWGAGQLQCVVILPISQKLGKFSNILELATNRLFNSVFQTLCRQPCHNSLGMVAVLDKILAYIIAVLLFAFGVGSFLTLTVQYMNKSAKGNATISDQRGAHAGGDIVGRDKA